MFNCMYSNCTLYPYLANVFYATRQPVHIYLSLFLIMMIAPYAICWIVTNYDIIYFTSLYSLLLVFATVLTHTFKTILYIFTYHYF